MFATILRILVLLVWGVWYAVYWQMGSLIVQSVRSAASRLDRLLLIGIAFCSSVMAIGGAVITAGWVPVVASDGLLLFGAVLFVGGVAGTFYSRAYLGRWWRGDTAVQPEHQIIDTGPYRLVRHPIYTAAIGLTLGAALVFPAWWNLLAALVVIVCYILKTADEDHVLGVSLPGYTEYQRRVRFRLIPLVW